MYSRVETVNSILRFYQTVIRHPYLNNATLIIPPVNGWNSIKIEGKNGAVLDLLCHLPYLRPENASEELIIYSETIPICYLENQDRLLFYPLPAHCIYLARAESYLGTSLILDTNEGTITEFCQTGSHITIPYEDYEALPKAEKWKAHRTTPIMELLDNWTKRYEELVWMLVPNPISQPVTGRFYSRAMSSTEEELIQQRPLEPWHIQDDRSDDDDREEDELDREQFKARKRERKHVADVYNTYLRHGWLDHFDKEGCKAELLELEKRKDADEMQQMAEANPDAALFD
ncbi:hypothetical protein V502_02561 [Pseudogymnoascus sp. VKM F-4520 (FW-2644)]|nr:hypothetical protein V502_02561 [Pseudogymnoascus sp. VKM F-4520 (FW-2644)]